MATGNAPSLGNSTMYNIPPSSTDHSDIRTSTRLRRQQPIKRESSRRIVVRPLVQRRREPSISSSCESLDESHSSRYHIPTEKVSYFFLILTEKKNNNIFSFVYIYSQIFLISLYHLHHPHH